MRLLAVITYLTHAPARRHHRPDASCPASFLTAENARSSSSDADNQPRPPRSASRSRSTDPETAPQRHWQRASAPTGFVAAPGPLSGEHVRDMMVPAVEHSFGTETRHLAVPIDMIPRAAKAG